MLMNTAEYISIIENIKSEITAAQYRATVPVNADMLLLEDRIGRQDVWNHKRYVLKIRN